MPKKYLVAYSYRSHIYDHEGECHDRSGIKSKIIITAEDVFTHKQIREIEDDIRCDFHYPEYLDECCVINILPLNG